MRYGRLRLALAGICLLPSLAMAQTPAPLPGILSKFSALFTSDFSGASTLAMSIPGLPDGVGQRCWANGWAPIGEVIKAHPLALTGKLATDAEARRLMIIALNNLCSNTDCTQVFTEESNAVATLGFGTPIPSFTALCAKVPAIRSTPATGNQTISTPQGMILDNMPLIVPNNGISLIPPNVGQAK